LNVFQYSDNSGGQGGHSKPAPAPKQAKPTPPATTAAPKPLGPPVYIDDSYGSTNYDEYETDYDQEYVDIEADLDYESHSDYDTADYDDQNNQQVDYEDVVNYDTAVPSEQESETPVLPSDKYSDYDYTYDYAEEEPPKTEEIVEPAPAPAPAPEPAPVPAQDPDDYDATAGCPGGDLVTCIDVCPGFNKVAFGLCVTECGKRCP